MIYVVKKWIRALRGDADKIGGDLLRNFDGYERAERFSINYKLTAVIQQMLYENTDMTSLAGFLDFHVSCISVASHINGVDAVIGFL